jgi:ATP-binding cassette subfamily F protein 3
VLSLSNIAIQFGGEYLFRNVTFQVSPHDRIGVVGSNGAGKTTLMRILADVVAPDEGIVQKAKYVSVGYLPQEAQHSYGRSLVDEVSTAFENVKEIERSLEELHQEMHATSPQDEFFLELIELQGEFQHKLEALDAYSIQSKVEKVLMGLGFSSKDFSRDCEEFSGGWQMRIALAKLLLLNPSLLLLDEPTNHLDLESLQWLEEYLRAYEGAIMLISHDRAFLDNMTKRTLALINHRLEDYAGNYSFYERESVARKELLVAAYNNQQQKLKQTEEFIDRFRYKATKARQVQSRIKQLEKVDLIEIEEEEAEIHFQFTPAKQSGGVVMELQNIAKSYGENNVLSNIHCMIERGDRIAFVGMNGAGKSTLARIIAGEETMNGGKRIVGHNVAISYFAQHQADELNFQKTVYQSVEEISVGDSMTRLRTMLGCFLFHGDNVEKKVGVLSGGEKSRLALVRMLLHPSNFLILDEPTNHLDMRSKKVLQDALINFEGTYIIVSHDRFFLDPLVNKVIEVKNHSITAYLGNISSYIEKKKSEQVATATPLKPNIETAAISRQEQKRLEAEERQRKYSLTKHIKEQVVKIEKEIGEKEKRLQECEEMMACPGFYDNAERVKTISVEYKNIGYELHPLYASWETLNNEMETLLKNAV